MGMKTLKAGEDFSFPADFGFTGSVSPRPHPTRSSNEFGDDAKLASDAKVPTFADGGPTLPGGKKMPKAGRAIMGALALGKTIGQAQAGMAKGIPGVNPAPAAGMAPPAGAMPNAVVPGGLPKPGGGAIPGMKKGGRSRRKMADGGPVGSIDKNGDWQIPESEIAKHGDGYDRLNTGAFVRPPAKPTPRPAQPQDGKAKGGKVDKWAGKAFKPSHKGRLHRALGVPADKPIPEGKMEGALHSDDPHVRHMAQAAHNINK